MTRFAFSVKITQQCSGQKGSIGVAT